MRAAFYLGRTGTGKTHNIQENIVDKLAERPADANSIIYLVPDQMTFQAEHQLVAKTNTGITRAHVLSFSRMAWRVLKETGGITKTQLQRHGVYMLLRKVLEEEKDNLRIYQKVIDKQGFIEHFEHLVTELKQHMVSTDYFTEKLSHFENQTMKTAEEQMLSDKLHDITRLWQRVEDALGDRYAGNEDYLGLLVEKIPESDILKGAEVYVDGFHSFTPQELNVLERLLQQTSKITFSLTIDRPYDEDTPHPLDLFYQTATTYRKLRSLCENVGCEVEDVVLFDQAGYSKSPALAHIARYFEKRPLMPADSNGDVTIQAAVNRRTEIEAAARSIRQKIYEGECRFKDIAVVTRNMEEYAETVRTTFADYDIPLFLDQKRPMIHHPVIEFIRSVLETFAERWRYEPLFRALKTDMLFSIEEDWESAREQVDVLENYCIAYGLKEKHWKQKERWTYHSKRTSAGETTAKQPQDIQMEQKINQLREKFASALLRFEKRLKKQSSIRGFCTALFTFLEEQYIPEKIEKLRDTAVENNDVEGAREHEQVWGALVELLEQAVEMAGEEEVSFTTFHHIMETGLETMSFRLVPPAIDQVTFADMERSRLANIKVVFLLGVNEGILPASFEEDGMLNDQERQWLGAEGIELAEDSSRKLLNEQFLIYRALSIANEELHISYPLADEEGKTLQPSVLIKQVKDIFPDIEEKLLVNEPQEYQDNDQAQFVGPYRKTVSFLIYQLQQWKRGYPISPMWWDVYNWYVTNNKTPSFVNAIGSLFYKNEPKRLSAATSKRLYGDTLKASVSRIEQFASCAFSQFAAYGLQLRERDIYKLEAPDIGQLFHAALKDMTEKLMKSGKDWGTVTTVECQSTAKECVEKYVPFIQRNILLSSNKYKYLQKKLEDTVVRAAEILSRQAKASGFSPIGIELGFGNGAELPPLQFQLEDGTRMELAGRIDRVDQASGADGVFVRIIDYKSSAKDVNLADIYYGLALQMLVYMDVILSFAEEWIGTKAKPAGVLYFHIHNPFIQANQHLEAEEIEKELFKRFKMKGLLTANEESIRLMDNTLTNGHSQIVPAAIRKDGTFYSPSVMEEDNFNELRRYIRSVLEKTGSAIMEGQTAIQPYKYKQRIPCTFCSFRSICQFDTAFAANEYRVLTTDEKDIVQQLFQKEGGRSANDD
ncbi:helicase-exonuclease AddAB subunit AddB [Bacillus piscicola]|uniref:helicase-exonuclease AddAB subunit AddB n=1 Tax=Bacillus piscicola TaxID=1632684 RepID=UPI001F0924D3|nr:helicase-exonuclease AddAB subunit AddB [Bacillus piscicola]